MVTQHVDLVEGLPAAAARCILDLSTRRHVARGAVLFSIGDLADRLFIVERGQIALRLPLKVGEGEHAIVVEERSAGETVGWSALIPPHRFTLEAIALVESEVLELPSAPLLAYFAAHTDIGWAVTQKVAATIGHRLQVIQAMWLREMQRGVEYRLA
jgi:CRP-like cAMP-binding protein